MNDILDQVWWGNPLRNYLIAAGIILFMIILKRLISQYVAGLLFKLVNRVWKDVDKKSFTGLVVQPLGLFLVILVSILSLHQLVFPSRFDVEVYQYTTKQVLHSIGTMILLIALTWLLLRIIDFIALILGRRADRTPDHSDNQLIVFFKDFFKVILVIIGIMMVLSYAFNINVGSLLTGLSIVGAAIALSLRESLENLIASFIIFFDKPFTTGDLVKVVNVTGTVEKIGLRSTRIRTDQKTFVTVPNKQMVDSVLDNLSLRTQRRGDLRLEIDLEAAPAQLENFVKGVREILQRKEIENSLAFMTEIGTQAFIVTGEYYTAPITLHEFNSIKQEINLKVLQLMEGLELEIAGAHTGVRIIQPGPIDKKRGS